MKRRGGGGGLGAVLAAAAILAALAVGVGCRRTRRQAAGPAPSPSAAALPARPLLHIDSPQFDLGTVVQGELWRHGFELKNAGSTRIELEERTEALGCAGVISPPTLDPGAAGHLEVACHLELYGPTRVGLALRSKAESNIVAQLELSGTVTPLLAFDPPLLSVRLPFGEERALEVRLAGALAEQAQYTVSDTGDAGFVVLSPQPGRGAERAVRLRVKGRRVGVHVGNLVARTNLARPREVSLPYSCEVVGNLEVTPSTPYFDLGAPDGMVRELTVRSSRPDFALHAVRVVEGPFAATIGRRGDDGEYRVLVSVAGNRLVGDARGTIGRLVLESNDRAEPEKELPLLAFGAPNRGAGQ